MVLVQMMTEYDEEICPRRVWRTLNHKSCSNQLNAYPESKNKREADEKRGRSQQTRKCSRLEGQIESAVTMSGSCAMTRKIGSRRRVNLDVNDFSKS